MVSKKNTIGLWSLGLVTVSLLVIFISSGIFIVNALGTIKSDDQELVLIHQLIAEDLKIDGLINNIQIDLILGGNSGSNGIVSDSMNGIHGDMVSIQSALKWKVDQQVSLNNNFSDIHTDLNSLKIYIDSDTDFEVHINEMANTLTALDTLLNSQKLNNTARSYPATKTVLYKTIANNQERLLNPFKNWDDNNIEQQLLRIGGLRYSNDKLKNIRNYLAEVSDFLDKNQQICKINQKRIDECVGILDLIKVVLPRLDILTGKLDLNIQRIQALTDSFNQLTPLYISGLEGDLNGDEKVDIFDLVLVAKNFGRKIQ